MTPLFHAFDGERMMPNIGGTSEKAVWHRLKRNQRRASRAKLRELGFSVRQTGAIAL